MISKIFVNRWFHLVLLLGVFLFFVISSFSQDKWRKDIRNWTFDTYNKTYPNEVSDDVVIVDIDEKSLQEIGQMPWPRTVMADLVTKLNDMGAAVITFDMVFAEPDRTSPGVIAENLEGVEDFDVLMAEIKKLPDNDTVFAQAIKDAGNVVTGFLFNAEKSYKSPRQIARITGKNYKDKLFTLPGAGSNLRVINKYAAGNGSFFATTDGDGIIRNVPILMNYQKEGANFKMPYPALSLETVRVLNGEKMLLVEALENGISHIQIGNNGQIIPTDPQGNFLIYYSRHRDNKNLYLSAVEILNNSLPVDSVKDKIVLIGTSAVGLKDIRSTPLDAFIPGVEVHLNIINQILEGKFLYREVYAELMEAVFILVTGLLIVVFLPFTGVVVQTAATLLISAAAVYAGIYAYMAHGVLIDVLYPVIAIGVLFVLSTILMYLRTESERKQVRDAFGLYISPDFMEELTADPDKLKLGGEIRDLSVMFTDIRSFTTISEGLTPEELIQLMNDFLTPMSDLVMSNKGTIDKYMGDAMMAFWNAPLDDADHERHACLTALGMQAALTPINEAIQEKAKTKGAENAPMLLKAGIGINSGPCAVGNMGSRQRFAYSALGDAVNLGARLESQTKNYGTGILIGRTTWLKVPELATLEFDLIQVKGKTVPEHIYGLLGDESLFDTPEFQKLKAHHEEMVSNYRAQKLGDALKGIKVCEGIAGGIDRVDLDGVYDLYRTRIDEMKDNPPAKDWDGVFIATSK
jgi:adenylate cyclase